MKDDSFIPSNGSIIQQEHEELLEHEAVIPPSDSFHTHAIVSDLENHLLSPKINKEGLNGLHAAPKGYEAKLAGLYFVLSLAIGGLCYFLLSQPNEPALNEPSADGKLDLQRAYMND